MLKFQQLSEAWTWRKEEKMEVDAAGFSSSDLVLFYDKTTQMWRKRKVKTQVKGEGDTL